MADIEDPSDPLKGLAGNWSEPKTTYGKVEGRDIKSEDGKSTIYPFNKVYESESGHILEIDDTPGSERLHQFHRSGTFEEVHPNGDKVTKVVRDRYTSVLRDDYIHIDGNQNLTVDKGLKILVNADNDYSTEGAATNFDIEVGQYSNLNIVANYGNINIRLKDGDANILMNKGDVNIRQEAGNYNHFVAGDYNLEVVGHMHVVVGEDQVTEIGGSRDVRVDGFFDHVHVTNPAGYKEINVAGRLLSNCLGVRQDNVVGLYTINVAGGRKTTILGADELSVTGIYMASATQMMLNGDTGVSFGSLSGGGVDVTADGRVSIVCPTHYSITAPMISLTGTAGININSPGGQVNIGGEDINVYSGIFKLTSAFTINLLSANAITFSSPNVNMDTPGALFKSLPFLNPTMLPALPAIPASLGLTGTDIFRIIEQKLPTDFVPYSAGPTMPIGLWRRTINGVTPLTLIRNNIYAIKETLKKLDTLAQTSQNYQQTLRGLLLQKQCFKLL